MTTRVQEIYNFQRMLFQSNLCFVGANLLLVHFNKVAFLIVCLKCFLTEIKSVRKLNILNLNTFEMRDVFAHSVSLKHYNHVYFFLFGKKELNHHILSYCNVHSFRLLCAGSRRKYIFIFISYGPEIFVDSAAVQFACNFKSLFCRLWQTNEQE